MAGASRGPNGGRASDGAVAEGRWSPSPPPQIPMFPLRHPALRSGTDVTPAGAAVPLRSGPASNPTWGFPPLCSEHGLPLSVFPAPCSPPSPVLCPSPTSPRRASSVGLSQFPVATAAMARCDGAETYEDPARDSCACLCSSTPRSRDVPLHCGTARVAFGEDQCLGTPNRRFPTLNWHCPHASLPTLRPRPRGQSRTTRGET